ncbi:esterase [Cypionkella aquatica]|uniref:Esterase n=1 Tax=Cypionkella aquatica TaxID=1756042 RepID=A0AA37X143_9RHOB|nr:PHB depolymerase family esterase [Cypionkella aquatica]GLS85116.1 esterase [Cypionkella aquatica]
MRALILALLLLAAPLAAPVAAAPQLVHLGARHYLIEMPDHPTGAMILVLHGGGGTPAQFADMTGFSAPALAEGYAVIYPAASQPKRITMWQTDVEKPGRADDFGFLDQVTRDAATRFQLDPARIYMSGFSNGAAMAEAYAMARAGRIKAVAAVSGTLDLRRTLQAQPMLIIHGTADPRVPYQGGRGAKSKVKTSFDAIPAQVMALVAAFGDLSQADRLIDPVDDGMQVTQSDYSNGQGVQLRLLSISGGGHGWPGRLSPKPKASDISATAEALRFFALHP